MSGKAPSHVVRFEGVVERKSPSLPRFVVAPAAAVARWSLQGTTVVEVTVEGVEVGRRSLKRWEERDGWFFDLTEQQCGDAGVDTDDGVSIELRLATTAPPPELRELIDADPVAKRAWESLSDARRRMIAEHVRAAKREDTRRRRASRALGVEP